MKKHVFFLLLLLIGNFIKFDSILEKDEKKDRITLDYTIENDMFSDDSIMVVLKKKNSSSKRKYTKKDFADVGCNKVVDLTPSITNSIAKDMDVESTKKVLSLSFKTKSKANIINVLKKLNKRDDVYYAGPDYLIKSTGGSLNAGLVSEYEDCLDKINFEESMEFYENMNEVVVGVIDSGIDGTHPYLSQSIITNLCRDFTSGEETSVNTPTDPYIHGTFVAGIIGARQNNNLNMKGVNPKVKLVSLRVLNEYGIGKSSYVAMAINFAKNNNIPILNMSVGWYFNENLSYDVALNTIIQSYDGLIVTASGNEGYNIDQYPFYPAYYNLPNLITVGATNKIDELATSGSFMSNYGEESVDIYAPGLTILSTYPCNMYSENSVGHIAEGYYIMNGTSYAAPFVAGTASILLSIDPTLSSSSIKDLIVNESDDINLSIYSDLQHYTKRLNISKVIMKVIENKGIFNETIYNSETINMSKNINCSSINIVEREMFAKLIINSSNEYSFILSSSNNMMFYIYNSKMEKMTINSSNNLNTKTILYLENGTYYLRVRFENSNINGNINLKIQKNIHIHDYSYAYSWKNNTTHLAYCECGTVQTQGHAIRTGTNRCLLCGGNVSTGFIEINSINKIEYKSKNGSVILTNGIIILVDIDIKDFLNGELKFDKYETNTLEKD